MLGELIDAERRTLGAHFTWSMTLRCGVEVGDGMKTE
jgi:hypothetical protein